MKNKKNILLLGLSMFSETGGIQTVCKTIAFALKSNSCIRFMTLSLNDHLADPRYIQASQFKGFQRKKISYILSSLIKGNRSSTIIITHIHLLPLAFLIRFTNPRSKMIMLAHGTEIRKKISSWKKRFLQEHIQIWAVSKFTASELTRIHQLKDNVIVINNCLDPWFQIPARFDKPEHLLKKYQLVSDQPILLTVCRLSRHEHLKGYDTVIDSMPDILKKYPNTHYLICGPATPGELERLNRSICNKNLQRHISLTGYLPEEELSNHYLLADIFIMPSSKEGFGLVFIEAAVCGCQIISGSKDGSSDALLNGKTGTMADPSCPGTLLAAINSCLSTKRTMQDQKQQQQMVIDHFGFKQYQQKIQQLV